MESLIRLIVSWAEFLEAGSEPCNWTSTHLKGSPDPSFQRKAGKSRGKGAPDTLMTSWLLQSLMSSVWVSCGCCNKMPKTEWLKATQIYSLTILAAKNLKCKCQEGWILLVALRESLLLAPLLVDSGSFQQSWASFEFWPLHSIFCLHLHMALLPVCLCLHMTSCLCLSV